MDTIKSILAEEVKIGAYQLSNRVIMAPLTRMRANEQLAVHELTAEYYQQRSGAGLIITEGSQISQQGQGYPATPGIYTTAQVQGWKKVTDAVHERGGVIFLQLWHVGRVSHSAFQPNQQAPVAPSALPGVGNTFLPDFSRTPYEIPHALRTSEIQDIVEDYRKAAENAKLAGFDGVEIHAANGYLIEQFLKEVANTRQDTYGGSIENRAKFLFEVLEAVLKVWPADKVGVRLSPYYSGTIAIEQEPLPTYEYVIKKLATYQLAYLHLVESKGTSTEFDPQDTSKELDDLLSKHIRKIYAPTIIAAGGFNKWKAEQAIAQGYVDAVAFGRSFISTPDLPYRLIHGIAPNPVDKPTIYGGGVEGYTDYGTYSAV